MERPFILKAQADAAELRQSCLVQSTDLAPLPRIAGLELLLEIQRGGQGVVYLAREIHSGDSVAVKVFRERSDVAEERARFEREVRILGELEHPGIVSVRSHGTAGDSSYYVMDYVEGDPLDEYARAHSLTTFDKASLVADICDAVHAAHLRGIIHRDLKPANVRVDSDGHTHVLDFGLAKLSTTDSAASLTATGQFIGSLPWASPEQTSQSQETPDVRSDVYSLGVILYQLVAGKLPYSLEGPLREVLDRICFTAPTPLGRRHDDPLETIILRALQKEPDRRYQSAGELAKDLRRFVAGEPIEARRENLLHGLQRTVRRHRAVAALSASLLAVALIAAGLAWSRAVQQQELTQQVERKSKLYEETHRFLQSMFVSINPAVARGREVTVREIVTEASEQLQNAALDPEVEATLQQTLGRTLLRIADFQRAAEHLRRAQSLHGDMAPRHVKVQCLEALALAEQSLGSVDTAAILLEEARQQIEQGGDEIPTADALPVYRSSHLLALARGETDAAQRWLDVATKLANKLPAEAELRLRTAIDRGQLYFHRGLLAEAEEVLREVLNRGAGLDPWIADAAQHHLATVLIQRGRAADAEDLLRENLTRRQKLYGPEHEETLKEHHTLSILLLSLRNPDAAELHARTALEGFRKIHGPNHYRTLKGESQVGRVLLAKRDTKGARAIFEATLAKARKTLNTNHPDLATYAIELGQLLLRAGESSGAVPLLEEAHMILVTSAGPTHRDTLRTLDLKVDALRRSGRNAEALAECRRLLAGSEEGFGRNALPCIVSRHKLALCLATEKHFEPALIEFDLALELLLEHYPSQEREQRVFLINRAICLSELDRFEAAEEGLLRAEALSPPGPATQEVLRELLSVYEQSEKTEKADVTRRRLEGAPASSEAQRSQQ